MKINIHNQTSSDVSFYSKILKKVFKNISDNKVMELIFVTEEEIRTLNKVYRKIDKVTDVLSFPDDSSDSNGDVFIALEKALLQAQEYKHSSEREIAFLAVHGYLHLKGYLHEEKEAREEMEKLQEEILKKSGLERIFDGKYQRSA